MHVSDDALMMAALLTFQGLVWLVIGLMMGHLLWGVS